MPENPINAADTMAAAARVMGIPWNALGTLVAAAIRAEFGAKGRFLFCLLIDLFVRFLGILPGDVAGTIGVGALEVGHGQRAALDGFLFGLSCSGRAVVSLRFPFLLSAVVVLVFSSLSVLCLGFFGVCFLLFVESF